MNQPTAQPTTPPAAHPKPVQNPLTLVMKIKSPADFQQLKALLDHIQSLPPDQNPIVAALNSIGTVHFARFTFMEENTKLAVITSYDGDFDTYINDFVDKIGAIFDQLLSHMEGAPRLPVAQHRDEFLAYVRRNDLRGLEPFYSAYPNLTVLDIRALAEQSGI